MRFGGPAGIALGEGHLGTPVDPPGPACRPPVKARPLCLHLPSERRRLLGCPVPLRMRRNQETSTVDRHEPVRDRHLNGLAGTFGRAPTEPSSIPTPIRFSVAGCRKPSDPDGSSGDPTDQISARVHLL